MKSEKTNNKKKLKANAGEVESYKSSCSLKKKKFLKFDNKLKQSQSMSPVTSSLKKLRSFSSIKLIAGGKESDNKNYDKMIEKENDSIKNDKLTEKETSRKKLDHVLKNSKVNLNSNKAVSKNSCDEEDCFNEANHYDSDADDDESDFEDLFLQLKKQGIKTESPRLKKSTNKIEKENRNFSKTSQKCNGIDPSSSVNQQKLLKSPETPILSDKKLSRKRSATEIYAIKEQSPAKFRKVESENRDNTISFSTPRRNLKSDESSLLNNIKKCLWQDAEDCFDLSAIGTKDLYEKNSCSKFSEIENKSHVHRSNKRKTFNSSSSSSKSFDERQIIQSNTQWNRHKTSKRGDITPDENDIELRSKNDISTPKSARSISEYCERQFNCLNNHREGLPRRKSVEKSMQRTPSTKMIRTSATTPLEKARNSLHVSFVPECLPCREREFKNIFSFVENKLQDGIGGCMYISGVPGTGKTATVTQVIKKLQSMAKCNEVPQFKYIEINGMRLSDPRQAYVLLWQGLCNRKEKLSASQAQRKLDAWFGKNDSKKIKMPTLLMVDELDLICTKKQDVVYNLLDWPTKSPSHLIVLTIANTMDMPERLFKGRVTSRLGLTRLTFLPYTYKQLEEIVLMRLKGLDAFTLDAIRLVTRKVAAVSGDARRSLDICRRATELPAPDENVKISHIEQAIREMTNSNTVKIIRSCSQMEKLFLRSISEVSTRSGVEEVDTRDVLEHFFALCTLEGYSRLPMSQILLICNRLKCFRLILMNHSQNGILQRLTLNVSQDDIHYGLKCSL